MTESGQLQPEDTLDDRGVDDILDEGISPPERLRGSIAKGTTHAEQVEGETIEDRLRQEEPEARFDPDGDGDDDENADPADQFAGEQRSGRIAEPNEGSGPDLDKGLVGVDRGIAGGAASAEEAAVHDRAEPPELTGEP